MRVWRYWFQAMRYVVKTEDDDDGDDNETKKKEEDKKKGDAKGPCIRGEENLHVAVV